jgi:excinuclease ABC subunit B
VIITFPNSPYKLQQTFEPAGDQPAAIIDTVKQTEIMRDSSLGNLMC